MARFFQLAPVMAVVLAATPALADPSPVRPDGWISEGGRILREGDPRPASTMVHPATRNDWIADCDSRLRAANTLRTTNGGFEGACRAWLDYYERIGATRSGYDFAYAIPVTLTTFETPRACPPPAPQPASRKPARRPLVHDKRIRL